MIPAKMYAPNYLLITAFSKLAEEIITGGAKKATKFITEKEVVKATRRGKIRKGERTTEILFTFGSPNYAEREFIKKAKKVGEPFPVKKILLKFPTKGKK